MFKWFLKFPLERIHFQILSLITMELLSRWLCKLVWPQVSPGHFLRVFHPFLLILPRKSGTNPAAPKKMAELDQWCTPVTNDKSPWDLLYGERNFGKFGQQKLTQESLFVLAKEKFEATREDILLLACSMAIASMEFTISRLSVEAHVAARRPVQDEGTPPFPVEVALQILK